MASAVDSESKYVALCTMHDYLGISCSMQHFSGTSLVRGVNGSSGTSSVTGESNSATQTDSLIGLF